MTEKDIKIIQSILGDGIVDDLKKSAIYKPESKTALNIEEMQIALQIVPRAVLSFLFTNLKHKNNEELCDLDLPWAVNAKMHVRKLGADNYSGEITKDGEKLYEFQHRSLPSIGLVLLSLFELYDLSLLNEIKPQQVDKDNSKIFELQKLIDEKLAMHSLIRNVVDQRIVEKELIEKLIEAKVKTPVNLIEPIQEIDEVETKKSKLRSFLENREKKRQELLVLDKSADIKCPDCDSLLHKKDSSEIIPCLCFGEFYKKPIKITKAENNKIKINFPKKFDIDNIELLLSALKNKSIHD